MEGSLIDIGAVMFLLALSAIFGYGIVFERVPEVISGWMLGITDNADVARSVEGQVDKSQAEQIASGLPPRADVGADILIPSRWAES